MSEPKTYAVTVTDPNGLRVSLRIVKAHSRAQAIRHRCGRHHHREPRHVRGRAGSRPAGRGTRGCDHQQHR